MKKVKKNLPSHSFTANLVSLVHEFALILEHIGKVQFRHFTSLPIKDIANDDLPTPVSPNITILGLGSTTKNIKLLK